MVTKCVQQSQLLQRAQQSHEDEQRDGRAVLNLAQRGPANPRRVGHGLPGLIAVEANLAQAEAQFAQNG